MTYRGKVKDGVVVFEGDLKPPEGVIVDVEQVQNLSSSATGSIWDDLKELAGYCPGAASRHGRQSRSLHTWNEKRVGE